MATTNRGIPVSTRRQSSIIAGGRGSGQLFHISSLEYIGYKLPTVV